MPALPPATRIGHVHLRVADLERSVAFYRDLLGFAVTADARPLGLAMVTLAAGDYHHHLGLNAFAGEGTAAPPPGHTGLHHVAILLPCREALAAVVARLLEQGHELSGADHGVSVSVYLDDPDGNGLELTYDRPHERWFDAAGRPVLRNDPFDPRELLTPAERAAARAVDAPA